jgi:Tir chaperone protein (CesT) family
MASFNLTENEEKYVALVTDFCLLKNLQNPQAVLGGEEFLLHGSAFKLCHVAAVQPGILCVQCNFGTIPPDREEEAYTSLLQLNAVRYESTAPMMALQSETGMVTGSSRIRLENLAAPVLDELLRRLAADAARWRIHIGQQEQQEHQESAAIKFHAKEKQ